MPGTDNPWLERKVLNWAHQGGAKEAPSSTLAAMRAALAAGAHALELDVHRTSDGVLVVCHDATVDRTTAGSGAIRDLSWQQLAELDNAYWWVPGSVVDHTAPEQAYLHRGKAPSDASFGIARLDSVLDSFPEAFVNLDIKQTAPAVEPYEHQLADLLRHYERAGTVIVASFHDVATERFRQYAPEFDVSLGTIGTAQFVQALRAGDEPPTTPHAALQVPPAFGDVVVVDEPFVRTAHRQGLAVHVWTIDDPDEMRRLLDLGVDGIMTDVPTTLATVLARRGLDYRARPAGSGRD